MKRRIALTCVWLGVLVAALGPRSAAAQREVAIDRFHPALDGHGFLGVQGTPMPGHLRVDTGLWLSWTEDLLEVDGVEAVDHRLRTDATVQLGLGGRFALALDVPVVWYQSGDTSVLNDAAGALPTVAAGDPRFVARARLVGDPTEQIGAQRHEGFGLALLGAVTAPLGSNDAFTSEAGPITDLRLLGDFRVLGLGIGLSLGWVHRYQQEVVDPVLFRDELHYGLGVEVPVPVADGLSALAEVRGWTDARFTGRARAGVEGDLGVRWRVGDFALTGAVGTNFGANVGPGSPILRALVGVQWSPREHDADGDGIPDDEDECPFLPEDFDGFEDEDGCLDPDNDGDLVPDEDDRCPNEAAEEGRDADFDGCTDPPRKPPVRRRLPIPDSKRGAGSAEPREDAAEGPGAEEEAEAEAEGPGAEEEAEAEAEGPGAEEEAEAEAPVHGDGDRDGDDDREGDPDGDGDGGREGDPDGDGDGDRDRDDGGAAVPRDAAVEQREGAGTPSE
ncbi:MAG: hypothetical protein ACODAU_05345 [Myxococcota bacterium]